MVGAGGRGGDGGTGGAGGAGGEGGTETTQCGNNVPEPGEECDDGNEDDGDGCSSACMSEAIAVSILPQGLADNTPGRTPFGELLTGVIDPAVRSWHRPSTTCDVLEATGAGMQAYLLENDTASIAYVDVAADLHVDGFLFVLAHPFDPASPLASCRFGVMAFTHTTRPVRTLIQMDPGESVWLVVSGADSSVVSTNDFSVRIARQQLLVIDEIEPNDTVAGARAIPDSGILLRGRLEAGDVDIFETVFDPAKVYHMQLYSGAIGACVPGGPLGSGNGNTVRRYFRVYAEDPTGGWTQWINVLTGNVTGCSWNLYWTPPSGQVDDKFTIVFEHDPNLQNPVVDPYWLRIDPVAP